MGSILLTFGRVVHMWCAMNTRMTIGFTAPQHEWLETEAARLGVSLGELIRRIVDQYRQRMMKNEGAFW